MRVFFALVASVLLASGSAAYADSISAGAVTTFTIDPASDTLGFGSSSETVFSNGVFTQTGTFYVGNSDIPNQTIPFTFNDQLTVDGVTKTLTFTGEDVVTTGPDDLTINALGPVNFGNLILNFGAVTVDGNGTVGQSLPVTLDGRAESPTPEPASIAFLATGMLGMALIAGKKLRA
jgi:hypothetical protein